jgi:hypothetical protein
MLITLSYEYLDYALFLYILRSFLAMVEFRSHGHCAMLLAWFPSEW